MNCRRRPPIYMYDLPKPNIVSPIIRLIVVLRADNIADLTIFIHCPFRAARLWLGEWDWGWQMEGGGGGGELEVEEGCGGGGGGRVTSRHAEGTCES